MGRNVHQVVASPLIDTTPVPGGCKLWLLPLVCGQSLLSRIKRLWYAENKCFALGSVSGDGTSIATSSGDEGFDILLKLFCQWVVEKIIRLN